VSSHTYRLDLIDLMEHSKLPMPVRMRIALEAHGMKFADNGRFSSITNESPEPLGVVTWWEDKSEPFIRFYRQKMEASDE